MNAEQLQEYITSVADERQVSVLKRHLLSRRLMLSYFYFVQEFWDVIVHDTPKWNWHIPYLCSELTHMLKRVSEDKPKEYDLVVNIPPGTTKSLVCTVFLPAWAWTQWPWMKFIKSSFSSTLSTEHAEYTRDIVQSEKYQELFPHIRIRRESSAKTKFKISYKDPERENVWHMGGGLYSTSVEAMITGFHSHVRLTDDPIDPNSAVSEARLNACNRWLDSVLSTRVVDKKNCPHIMIQQRVHKKDPSGMEIHKRDEKNKRIKLICLPGEIVTSGNRDRVQPESLLKFYDANGGYLDPIRLDQEAIDNMEMDLGTYGKKSQVDQNPMVPGSGMFEPDNITIRNPKTFNEPAEVVAVVRYWDNASSENAGAYTVGLKLAQLKNGRYLIMDLVRGRWGTDRREQIKEDTTVEDGPHVRFLQEQEGGSGGKDQAIATQRNLEQYGNQIQFDRPTGDKIYRADPVSVAVNRGFVQMLEAPWNKDVIEELRDFPNSDYKDITDTLSGAYNYYLNTKRAGTW